MGFHSLVNTTYFSEAANDFWKNGENYTTAPRGSRDYYEYWEEQERRCLQGYQVGDLYITGRHYFYLNFTPIWRVPDDLLIAASNAAKHGKTIVADKILTFPRFWEIDYEWWNFKHIAWFGGVFMGINSPGGRHLCCLKTRGAGFSYKEAADGVYNYIFLEGSKSYYFAGLEEYLIKDGILNKVQEMLDHINKHSPYWKLNRGKKNTLMHQKASYLDDVGQEISIGSEIFGVTIDNPNKTRGKRGRKIVFEEAGSFKNLKKALEISQGAIKSGSIYIGQISVFGTGGEEGPGIEGLDDIYTSPEAWDMLPFPNIYDEAMEATACGYFVPCYRANEATFDEDGNVDVELAIKLDNIERAKKEKSKDPRALDSRKAEYPRNASEALMRMSFNMYNIAEIDRQIKRISGNKTILGYLRHGTLIQGDNGPEFVPLANANPIIHYPHKNTDDLEGCLTIFEKPVQLPYFNEKGDKVQGTPDGLYFIVVDPVYKEDAEDLTSLFVIQVWKQYNTLDPSNQGLPIAWWVSRPRQLRNAYRMLFMMANFWNAPIQSEIAGGGQGIVDYAREQKLLHKLEYEISIDNREINIDETKKNRSYFMNMTTDVKMVGLRYHADWSMEVRGITEQGTPIINMNHLYDIGTLREMRKFNDKRNADRISCGVIAMYMLKKKALEVALGYDKEADVGFYNRRKFGYGNSRSSGVGVTTAY